MRLSELEGKYVVLNYSFGPWYNEEQGGDDLISVWKVKNGKLEQFYHPCEPDRIEITEIVEEAIRILKKKKIKQVFTPDYNGRSHFKDFEWDYAGGEHRDEEGVTDWIEYEGIVDGDANYDRLVDSGLEVIVFGID